MVLDSYAALLTSLSIRYYNSDDFFVKLGDAMISVSISASNLVRLSDYVGLANCGIQKANRLCKELSRRFPGYRFYPDKYSGYYEIEMEANFPYTTIDALHESVVSMAKALEEGIIFGRETLGEGFAR